MWLPITQVRELFACEIEKFKQNLLTSQVLNGTNACLFADVTQIANDAQRLCVKHNAACVT